MTTTIVHDLDLDACARRALTTAMLRRLADVLDADEPHSPIRVYAGISDAQYGAAEAARVAIVDRIAAALGLSAAPAESTTAGYWDHEADTRQGEMRLRVHTHIDRPGRCACGAECTHTMPGGAR